jgi:hypothetical protein
MSTKNADSGINLLNRTKLRSDLELPPLTSPPLDITSYQTSQRLIVEESSVCES